MTEGLLPGWYSGPDGTRRYWDGQQWLTPEGSQGSATSHSEEITNAEQAEVQIPSLQAHPVGGSDPVVGVDQPSKRKRWPWIAGAAVVVLVGTGLAAVSVAGRESPAEYAEAQCQGLVTENLKSPNTAVFQDLEVKPLGDSLIEVGALMVLNVLADGDVDLGNAGPKELMEALAQDETQSHIEETEQEIRGQVGRWAVDNPGRVILSVSGYVDSENGFGATVHSEFSCIYDEQDGSREVYITSIGSDVYRIDSVEEIVDAVGEYGADSSSS